MPARSSIATSAPDSAPALSGLRTAVALFIFNRPGPTQQVLDAVRRAAPRRFLVVADGPRTGHPTDLARCTQTRQLIESVDWPCEVSRCYSEINLGCKQRMASGLDWVFAQVEEAIILEDDCLPHPSFFPYCEELLERYRRDESVHMISGSRLLKAPSEGLESYYFSRLYHIWGWASWARAWRHYEVGMRQWPLLRDRGWLEGLLPDPAMARFARYIFDETFYADRFTTWDYQWVFASWLRNALSITPAVNLVSNIGGGTDATHTQGGEHPYLGLPPEAMEFPLRHPALVAANDGADLREWTEHFPALARSERWRQKLQSILRREWTY